MPVKISGKGVDLGSSLKEYARKELGNITDKYIGENVDSNLTVSSDHKLFDVEVYVRLHMGFIMRANGSSDDPYRAVGMALERLEERIKRHKNRIKNKYRRANWSDSGFDATKYIIKRQSATSGEADEEHLIIADQKGYVLLLSVSEAVMKLDLTDAPVVMFKNIDSEKINVVYKRPDGHIGWIDYKEQ
ncbi:MAG: ribosome-associated translation inhibitor RaiA [Holosporales bacterium]|jgi:ribosomal subunit interface protein|nr:ribosome-associated translation inhibitor RaiA [Holosporales bacterium]